MSSRVRRPETVKLDISRGDWVLIKKRLNSGETRRMFARMMKEGITADRLDVIRVGWSKLVSYLLDWSITDADDKPIVIRDQGEDVIGSALDALDTDCFSEILKAVEAHEERAAEELKAELARPTHEIASPAISQ